jgi:NAD+ synthase (glutamine-hydrolysing)
LAVKALGARNVLGVTMPSRYSSKKSAKDARTLSKNLGNAFETIPIDGIYEAYILELEKKLKTRSDNLVWENMQARIRGNILMAISNRFDFLVLSTGNKSELSVGYCTLYGDMAGGLSPLSDMTKKMVYQVARYINKKTEIIPKSIMEKEPSAELKPGQKDTDTLPPYDILDSILERYIQQGLSEDEIVEVGHSRKTTREVIQKVKHAEYKRRQAPPGLKITPNAFGVGRKMPIASKY